MSVLEGFCHPGNVSVPRETGEPKGVKRPLRNRRGLRAETKLALAMPCEKEEDQRSTGNNFFVDLWKGTEESIRFRLALIIVYNGVIFI